MNKRVHSRSIFQDEWLYNKKYQLWIAKASDSKNARCILCQKDLDVSTMGSGALDSHATGSKHKQKVLDRSRFRCFFKKASTVSDRETASSSSSKTNTAGADALIINQNTLVAEILWCLKVVMSHFSYRSCLDLNDLIKRMFSDSEVSAQFSLSKTKCRYMILSTNSLLLREIRV